MIKKINSAKILFLILLLESGRGVIPIKIFGVYHQIFLAIVLLVYLLFVPAFIKCISNSKLGSSLILWLGYIVISSLAVIDFSLIFFITIPLYLLSGYYIVSMLKDKTIDFYIQTMYLFAIVSLFFMIWFTFSQSSLISVLGSLGFRNDFGDIGVLIFNIDPNSTRNQGFTWEPGPFACYTAVALFFHIHKNSFKFDKLTLVFMITIITTQSSTGGVLLILILFWMLIRKVHNRILNIIVVPLFAVLMLFLYIETDFLAEKISFEFGRTEHLDQVLSKSKTSEQAFGMSRFNMFLVHLNDIKERPLFGYASNDELAWTKKNNFLIQSGGTGFIIARFGLLMFLLWLWMVYRAGKNTLVLIGDKHSSGIKFLLIVLIISFAFSSVVIASAMFVFYMFSLNGYFEKNDQIPEERLS
ncbi:MAG: O-antigen ligase family protein [Bacteroidia bacterium]|nr:O-antigen ligase family protein [Bacteroidia bacterium]